MHVSYMCVRMCVCVYIRCLHTSVCQGRIFCNSGKTGGGGGGGGVTPRCGYPCATAGSSLWITTVAQPNPTLPIEPLAVTPLVL